MIRDTIFQKDKIKVTQTDDSVIGKYYTISGEIGSFSTEQKPALDFNILKNALMEHYLDKREQVSDDSD